MRIELELTEDEHLLINRASEVAGISMHDFIKYSAIEDADQLAHRHVDGGEGFADDDAQ